MSDGLKFFEKLICTVFQTTSIDHFRQLIWIIQHFQHHPYFITLSSFLNIPFMSDFIFAAKSYFPDLKVKYCSKVIKAKYIFRTVLPEELFATRKFQAQESVRTERLFLVRICYLFFMFYSNDERIGVMIQGPDEKLFFNYIFTACVQKS